VKKQRDGGAPHWYDWAQMSVDKSKAKPTCAKRKSHQPLYNTVVQSLRDELSLEIILDYLNREYRAPKMNISHETTYQWVLKDSLAGSAVIFVHFSFLVVFQVSWCLRIYAVVSARPAGMTLMLPELSAMGCSLWHRNYSRKTQETAG